MINNCVTDAVADQDLHFLESARGPFSHDVGHTVVTGIARKNGHICKDFPGSPWNDKLVVNNYVHFAYPLLYRGVSARRCYQQLNFNC